MKDSQLIDTFQRARKDNSLVVIEGVQALKHAVRFKAEIQEVITCDIAMLTNLLEDLAKDVKNGVLSQTQEVSEATFAKLSPQPPRTRVIATALRTPYSMSAINPEKPIVYLEDPRDLENIGAVIRVAAAADVGAVIISGRVDVWHPAVVRGAAGLQFALPVFSSGEISDILPKVISGTKRRIVVSLEPTGRDINKCTVPRDALFIFGTERYGISKKVLEQSDLVVKLPMKEGVSSLNLATSVAATLYRM